jgi:hypothetical protein
MFLSASDIAVVVQYMYCTVLCVHSTNVYLWYDGVDLESMVRVAFLTHPRPCNVAGPTSLDCTVLQ